MWTLAARCWLGRAGRERGLDVKEIGRMYAFREMTGETRCGPTARGVNYRLWSSFLEGWNSLLDIGGQRRSIEGLRRLKMSNVQPKGKQ
jgi:hypothetical protein